MTMRPFALLLGLALSGCSAALVPSSRATSQAGPEQVVARAETVLRAYGIPVARSDRTGYTVRSGSFQVEPTWNGVPVEDRVDCGVDEQREPIARGSIIELQVEVDASAPRRQNFLSGSATPVTRVRLESWGELLGRSDTAESEYVGVPCALTREFSDALVRQIAGDPGGEPMAPPTPGTPGDPFGPPNDGGGTGLPPGMPPTES